MSIEMIPPARREMLRAARRCNRERQGLGDRFPDAVRERLIAIREYPSAHPPIIDSPYRRKLPNVFPSAQVYRVDGDVIAVTAVANFSRMPRYWSGRSTRVVPARNPPRT